MNPTKPNPIIMVSSTVDGIEDLLEQVFSILSAKYTVWMSYKGTVPVDSTKSNFENCLEAVRKCDYFLGILTTGYGSGIDGAEPSITHQEMREALKRENLPRWFLSHRDVEFAYDLVRNLGHKIPEGVQVLNETVKSQVAKAREKGKEITPVIADYRVLELYGEVIQAKKALSERRGNWAQPFYTDRDGQIFVKAQFLRHSQAVDEVKNGPLAVMNKDSAQGRDTP